MCSGVWCVAVPLCWAGPGQSGVCLSVSVCLLVCFVPLSFVSRHVLHGRLDCTHGGVLSVHTVRLGRIVCG